MLWHPFKHWIILVIIMNNFVYGYPGFEILLKRLYGAGAYDQAHLGHTGGCKQDLGMDIHLGEFFQDSMDQKVCHSIALCCAHAKIWLVSLLWGDKLSEPFENILVKPIVCS